MQIDEAHLAWMRDRWTKRFNRPLPAANRQQAMIPDGATKLENNHGSAPGIWLEDDRGRWVAMLPGVPREMRGMLGDDPDPRCSNRAGRATCGRSIAHAAHHRGCRITARRSDRGDGRRSPRRLACLSPWAQWGRSPADGARRQRRSDAEASLTAAASRLRASVGEWIYGEQEDDLAAVVLDLCRARGLTIGVAESCTGGLLGARLTAIPGSSDVVHGGVIAYDNDVKRTLLGVTDDALRTHGAVSETVVRQMASGSRSAVSATIGLAITGVAGPSGGSEEKPVGTVWIASDIQGDVQPRLLRLWGDREEIRARAAQWTLRTASAAAVGGIAGDCVANSLPFRQRRRAQPLHLSRGAANIHRVLSPTSHRAGRQISFLARKER